MLRTFDKLLSSLTYNIASEGYKNVHETKPLRILKSILLKKIIQPISNIRVQTESLYVHNYSHRRK